MWRHKGEGKAMAVKFQKVAIKKRPYSSTVIVGLAFVAFYSVFQINLSLSPILRFKSFFSTKNDQDKKFLEQRLVVKKHQIASPTQHSQSQQGITCDRSHGYYDHCSINGSTILDSTTSTFYLVNATSSTSPPFLVEKIRPYPRKWEQPSMSKIKEVTLTTSGPPSPECQVNHKFPALVFSVGVYAGNFFHEFNDGFIPLFITVNSIFPEHQEFILVISSARGWWISKYADLLKAFSKHPIINLDNDTNTHCFPSATLGLITHGFTTINPKLLPNSKSFAHFHSFLDKAYTRSQISQYGGATPKPPRPRLVLAIRNVAVGRAFLNLANIKTAAEEVGFEVIIFEPTSKTPLRESYALLKSSHAMIGVHGAALTHSLFLRPGSVFVQVVPLGCDWLAAGCFGNMAKDLGLEYMEYKIVAEESSLIDKYDKNGKIIKVPYWFHKRFWTDKIMKIYLREQNVRLDLKRFSECLNKVYVKAKELMDREG